MKKRGRNRHSQKVSVCSAHDISFARSFFEFIGTLCRDDGTTGRRDDGTSGRRDDGTTGRRTRGQRRGQRRNDGFSRITFLRYRSVD